MPSPPRPFVFTTEQFHDALQQLCPNNVSFSKDAIEALRLCHWTLLELLAAELSTSTTGNGGSSIHYVTPDNVQDAFQALGFSQWTEEAIEQLEHQQQIELAMEHQEQNDSIDRTTMTTTPTATATTSIDYPLGQPISKSSSISSSTNKRKRSPSKKQRKKPKGITKEMELEQERLLAASRAKLQTNKDDPNKK